MLVFPLLGSCIGAPLRELRFFLLTTFVRLDDIPNWVTRAALVPDFAYLLRA